MRNPQIGVESVYRPGPVTFCAIPLFVTSVEAGFPSPAEDYIEGRLDLNEHLIRHPAATFFVRVAGDSMLGAGIHPGDILVVDRALEPADKKVVIAVVDGELTVKRIRIIEGRVLLVPENVAYEALRIEGDMQVEIWGVVTNVIHPL
ncbi:MAG: peptidase S24 [Deltaproteobacteria bacterium RIFOXYD12_FULL_57_12]|nr:MAG: peptidase S24 [Deltaproteobacteria bacterium RIFOXYD12_FULL_57_12]